MTDASAASAMAEAVPRMTPQPASLQPAALRRFRRGSRARHALWGASQPGKVAGFGDVGPNLTEIGPKVIEVGQREAQIGRRLIEVANCSQSRPMLVKAIPILAKQGPVSAEHSQANIDRKTGNRPESAEVSRIAAPGGSFG